MFSTATNTAPVAVAFIVATTLASPTTAQTTLTADLEEFEFNNHLVNGLGNEIVDDGIKFSVESPSSINSFGTINGNYIGQPAVFSFLTGEQGTVTVQLEDGTPFNLSSIVFGEATASPTEILLDSFDENGAQVADDFLFTTDGDTSTVDIFNGNSLFDGISRYTVTSFDANIQIGETKITTVPEPRSAAILAAAALLSLRRRR